MNKRLYPLLQLKRCLKKYPAVILVTLVTIVAVAALAYLTFAQSRSSEDTQKVRIGIVGDISDSYLGMGIYALQNFDSSRFSVEFEQMDETKAEKALEAREISGYINIPDDFIKGILKGENTPAQYYIRKGAVNFGSIIISEITGTVSDLVTQSQTAIYSMQDIARAYGKNRGLSGKTKTLNLMYIDYILNRTNMFETELTGVADELSLGGYYLCAMAVFMLMLWGISCCSILSGRSIALSRLLCARKMGAFEQTAGEYAGFLLITIVTFFAFCAVVTLIPGAGASIVPELSGTGVWEAFWFTVKMLPVILMITSMHFAIYELMDNTVGAVLMQFLVSFGLGYISGCFYPLYFFPEALQEFSRWLPCGAGFSYARKILGNGQILTDMAICLAYFAAFTGISVLVRRMRMAGDGQ